MNRVVRSTKGLIAQLFSPMIGVTCPLAGDGTVGDLKRTLTDQQLGRNELLAPLLRSGTWHPEHATGMQAGAWLEF